MRVGGKCLEHRKSLWKPAPQSLRAFPCHARESAGGTAGQANNLLSWADHSMRRANMASMMIHLQVSSS